MIFLMVCKSITISKKHFLTQHDLFVGILDNFTCNGDASTLHERGCIVAFGDFIKAHAMSLALAGTVIAIIQLFGLLFSCFIARQIKKNNPY